MRDDSYLESEVGTETSASTWRNRAATAIGAALSLAILAGVVIWSYRLGVRDAAEIPVIRAELGVTKARPEEPGGLEVDYQGRAVYGVVSGETGAAGSAEGYAEPPARLADEDVAPLKLSPEPAPRPIREGVAAGSEAGAASEYRAGAGDAATAEASTDAAEPAAPSMAPPPAPPPVEIGDTSVAATETDAAPTLQEEVEAAVQAVNAEQAAEAEAAGEDEASSRLAPANAPNAQPRPDKVALPIQRSDAEIEAAAAEAAVASAIQIQLGAFTSVNIAEAQWEQIRSRNGDLLTGRGRVVTPVISGGRKLWRLRAGPFASIEEASALCRGLKARNEACIVARSGN